MDPLSRQVSEDCRHEARYLSSETAQCHTSNLLLLQSGDLLCAWFGGSEYGLQIS
jgi:predicted neuraminidase